MKSDEGVAVNRIRPIDCLFAPQISYLRNAAPPAALSSAPCSTKVASILKAMDRYGIERTLLTPCQVLPDRCDRPSLCADSLLSEHLHLVREYPSRFSVLAGYNAHEISDSLRTIEQAIGKHDVKGLYVPGDGVPRHDRRMYPAYAKCAELRVPIVIADDEFRPAASRQVLKDVSVLAGDFPELTVVAACGRWPGIEAAHSSLETHENVFLAMPANARAEQVCEIRGFLNSDLGSTRCVWGSNGEGWNVALAHLGELGLEEQALSRFASENAMRIFALQTQRRPQPEVDFVLMAE